MCFLLLAAAAAAAVGVCSLCCSALVNLLSFVRSFVPVLLLLLLWRRKASQVFLFCASW